MVWLVEIIAGTFFNNDKTAAYRALTDSGLWNIYVESYDTAHTLGGEYCIATQKGIDAMKFIKSYTL